MKKLGEILLEKGLLTSDQLENALRRQSLSGGRLGEHLVQMMLVDEAQICQILGMQQAVSAAMPSDLDNIPGDVIQTISAEIARSYRAVPFKLLGKRLHVAMLDAGNIEMVDELSHKTNYIIRPYICMESVLYRALNKYYQIALQSTTRAEASIAASMMRDMMMFDDHLKPEQEDLDSDKTLVALDDSGQFALFDRINILGEHTKTLFVEALGAREIINYLLNLMEQLCDRVVFMILDGEKNYFWSDITDFRRGKAGLPLRNRLQKSVFWSHYLTKPKTEFVDLESISGEIPWAAKMLKMEDLQAFVLVPIHISKRLTGIAMGGADLAFNLREEVNTFDKLRIMAECSLTILRCKRTIQDIE